MNVSPTKGCTASRCRRLFALSALTLFIFCSAPFTAQATHRTQSTTLSKKVPYRQEIEHAARLHGVDPTLMAALVKVESGFNPKAKSPGGARGLTQLQPRTASRMGVRNIHDPQENLKGGARYLAKCMAMFNNEEVALMAYNRGPGAVKKMKGAHAKAKSSAFVRKVKNAQRGYQKTAQVATSIVAINDPPSKQKG
ncbi:MAG: lytic transglycosylase domain-containing protein [Desulfobulbaceae bacterium]|nr:lytic transglycosylase domain-containing protein [Desulfobulbaceae bacterium]